MIRMVDTADDAPRVYDDSLLAEIRFAVTKRPSREHCLAMTAEFVVLGRGERG
jgi:hypothetical protein